MDFPSSLKWLLVGAESVALVEPVQVPMLAAFDDPRPRVVVSVDGQPMQALLDPGGWTRIGELAAIRLGIPARRGRAVLDLTMDGLVLSDVRAEVVPGEELVLGVGVLDGLVWTLRASDAVVRVARPGEADADLNGAALTRVNGRWVVDGWAIDGGQRSASPGVAQWQGGTRWVQAAPLGLSSFRMRWAEEQVLGGDALALADIVFSSNNARLTVLSVEEPADRWPASVLATRQHLEQSTAADRVIEPAYLATLPGGDPGQSWVADRWAALSLARWRESDVEGAIDAAVAAVRAGRDRCEPWVHLGELLLREGRSREGTVLGRDITASSALAQGLALWRLDVDDEPGFEIAQPDSCRRARALEVEARWLQGEVPKDGLPAAIQALRDGEPERASALIRATLDEPGPFDAARWIWLGLADAAAGRSLPARASLEALASSPEADRAEIGALAVRLAEQLGLAPDDRWPSAWLAAWATREGLYVLPNPTARALHPGVDVDPRRPSLAVLGSQSARWSGREAEADAWDAALARSWPWWAWLP